MKLRSPETLVVGVEPSLSPLLSKGFYGSHPIQGIGANFIPDVLDSSVIDRIMAVDESDAKICARRLAREEGLLVGISSGAALSAALSLGKELGEGSTVVALLPDSGERYLTTDLFGD